jgi:N-acetylmuramic acid 6-phosphate etherase
MKKITESDSLYCQLEQMSVHDLLEGINTEDKKVAAAVKKALPQIETLINEVLPKLQNGGRLFYMGSGTSGRLGVLDASECPPTFGVDKSMVTGLIAGGDKAIRTAIEKAEDNYETGWQDLVQNNITENDFVIGISSSGTTPYVVGALRECSKNNIKTGCITCNPGSPIASETNFPVEVIVGPEFVTGSTRMKAGTAQKMVLNMISTTLMIRIGRIKGNKMIDLQLNNQKLIDRGIRIIMGELHIPYEEAQELLLKQGSVRNVLMKHNK